MKCIYCGKETTANKYTISIDGSAEDLQCCGRECYLKTKEYIKNEGSKKKTPFYIIAAILVVLNLFILQSKPDIWWMYFPMIGLGALISLVPSMYITHYFFESMGIVRARKIVRLIGCFVMAVGLALTLSILTTGQ